MAAPAPDDFLGLASKYLGNPYVPILPQGDVLPNTGFNILGTGLGLLNPGLIGQGMSGLPGVSGGGAPWQSGLGSDSALMMARNKVQGQANVLKGMQERTNPGSTDDPAKQAARATVAARLAGHQAGQQAGQFTAQTGAFQALPADQQQTASQIMQMAVDKIGPAAGPVVGALLLQENGLGGQTGDQSIGGSYGPLQFYTGGQLPGYAAARGMPLAQAGAFAAQNPVDAASWALDSYLGNALRRGVQQGHTGEALLIDALRGGQNPGALSSLPHYQQYANRLQGFTTLPDHPRSGPMEIQNLPYSNNGQPLTINLMGNPPVNPTAQGFLAEAEKLRGVPYVWGGTQASGVDCSGLVIVAAQAAGRPLQGRPTAEGIYNQTARVDPSAVQAGDLVFFTGPGAGPGETIGHVGIVTQQGIMLNAPEPGRNVDYANYNSAYWAPKIVGYGRLN